MRNISVVLTIILLGLFLVGCTNEYVDTPNNKLPGKEVTIQELNKENIKIVLPENVPEYFAQVPEIYCINGDSSQCKSYYVIYKKIEEKWVNIDESIRVDRLILEYAIDNKAKMVLQQNYDKVIVKEYERNKIKVICNYYITKTDKASYCKLICTVKRNNGSSYYDLGQYKEVIKEDSELFEQMISIVL